MRQLIEPYDLQLVLVAVMSWGAAIHRSVPLSAACPDPGRDVLQPPHPLVTKDENIEGHDFLESPSHQHSTDVDWRL